MSVFAKRCATMATAIGYGERVSGGPIVQNFGSGRPETRHQQVSKPRRSALTLATQTRSLTSNEP